ncbi:MAG: spore cortex biosynthesis protein YabQ [Oscillospiraceae bacterium]|jgi:spore cortex biosynthesis protein YabQ|nr:spore cortex biosynthesis protein YabQ [Oscillospiraceae bacterium]
MFNSVAAQTISFAAAFLTGAALCLVYDFFRVLRLAFRPSVLSAFVEDMIYWLLAALVTFGLLLIRCSGVIRGYAVLGEFLGFIACRNSISVLIMKVSGTVIGFFRRIKRLASRRLVRPITKKVSIFSAFLEKKREKAENNFKKGLKRGLRLLYNHHRNKKLPMAPPKPEPRHEWTEYVP